MSRASKALLGLVWIVTACVAWRCSQDADTGLAAYGESCAKVACQSDICLKLAGGVAICGQECITAPCPNGDPCIELGGGDKACKPEAKKAGYGESCKVKECVSGLCVKMAAGASICSQSCDKQACPNNDACITAGSNKICKPGSPVVVDKAKYGESCKTKKCASNICVNMGGGTAKCSQHCDKQACPNNDMCILAGGKKLCKPGISQPDMSIPDMMMPDKRICTLWCSCKKYPNSWTSSISCGSGGTSCSFTRDPQGNIIQADCTTGNGFKYTCKFKYDPFGNYKEISCAGEGDTCSDSCS